MDVLYRYYEQIGEAVLINVTKNRLDKFAAAHSDLEVASNNDSYVSFSAFNNQGHEDIESFFPLPFEYDNSNLSGRPTNLGTLSTSPSLATPSPFFPNPDNPPINSSGTWNSPNAHFQYSSSHQLPRPAKSADAALLSNAHDSHLTDPSESHITITTSQHETPEHGREPFQTRARTVTPDSHQLSSFQVSGSSPDSASASQSPPQQKSTRARPRGKKDKQLKCTICFKAFSRRCDLKVTTAHSDVTLLAAPIPKDLLYAKIFAGTSIPSTARALSLAIFQTVERLSQDRTTASDTLRSSIPSQQDDCLN
ncbi:hypothetical protein BKA64DRAFT_742955 [Cadophora sp. MPI-SDFR-AT-0126]|nr:hypothetical protein BKA64DRAFT_742955 [Leotiomycetes sp. MPI-SDFR-AT-0126]